MTIKNQKSLASDVGLLCFPKNNVVIAPMSGAFVFGGFMVKKCSHCGESKMLSMFGSAPSAKEGKHSWCKECLKNRAAELRILFPEQHKKYAENWRAKNPDYKPKKLIPKTYLMVSSKKCRCCQIEKPIAEFHINKFTSDGKTAKCKKCHNAMGLLWKKNNKERIKETDKIWVNNNRDKVRKLTRAGQAKLRKTAKGNLVMRIVCGINASLKNGSKNRRKWEDLVNYNINDLCNHLEKNFLDGMNWENRDSWHIDHIIPVTAFNFETPEDVDFKKCWALSNLRPLWAKDNLSKGGKLIKPFQPSLLIK